MERPDSVCMKQLLPVQIPFLIFILAIGKTRNSHVMD